jgi:hypothetical protein
MKATLEFELPQDSGEHQTALDGWKWRMIVNETLENLRHDLKYNSDLNSETVRNLESVRAFIFQRMTEENLCLE